MYAAGNMPVEFVNELIAKGARVDQDHQEW